jgi:glycosyltransferase involved in cell wall biosynthesis
MTYPQITVVMPSIPARAVRRNAALASIAAQTLSPAAVSVAIDVNKEGAPATRQRALDAAATEWVAFLDDDDAFMPVHLEHLYRHAMDTGADFVYSYFTVIGGRDPFLGPGERESKHFLNEFDPENPVETTVTTLIRTELAKDVGFHKLERGEDTNTGEDYGMVLGCVKRGAVIKHLVERTWYWTHHGGNTSGLPTKGDAAKW